MYKEGTTCLVFIVFLYLQYLTVLTVFTVFTLVDHCTFSLLCVLIIIWFPTYALMSFQPTIFSPIGDNLFLYGFMGCIFTTWSHRKVNLIFTFLACFLGGEAVYMSLSNWIFFSPQFCVISKVTLSFGNVIFRPVIEDLWFRPEIVMMNS